VRLADVRFRPFFSVKICSWVAASGFHKVADKGIVSMSFSAASIRHMRRKAAS